MKKIALIYLFLYLIPFSSFSQQQDTLINTKLERKSSTYKKISPYIIPATFITYGLISLGDNAVRNWDYAVKDKIRACNPNFHTSVDNYIQYAPAVAALSLNLLGVKGKNNFRDKSFILGLSLVMMCTSSRAIKIGEDRTRPDGGSNSFPSGHTATAFASAEFLIQEYKDTSPWIGYAGYAVATSTGVMRMYNNKHWLSDVVMGAGIGILSTKVAYVIYPAIKSWIFPKASNHFSVAPNYQGGVYGINLNNRF